MGPLALLVVGVGYDGAAHLGQVAFAAGGVAVVVAVVAAGFDAGAEVADLGEARVAVIDELNDGDGGGTAGASGHWIPNGENSCR